VDGRTSYSNEVPYVNNITENSFKIWTMTGNSAKGSFWKTSGYLAENQYATPIRLIYYVVGTTTNYEGMTDVVSQGKTILEQVNEGLESKADRDLSNCSIVRIIDTYINGTSGYRIWSDGYCKQWGLTSVFTTNPISVELLKSYTSEKYCLVFTPRGTNARGYAITVSAISDNSFSAICGYGTNSGVSASATGNCQVGWEASGYLAEGEY
jgi:hypothetical protein